MRIYLITLFLIIADFQIKDYYAMGLEINKIETRANQPDLNGTYDGHPEPMDPDFPGLEDLAIISELDGASRLEPNSLELRQSQGCNDNYPASSQCPSWANAGYCSQSYVQFMADNCKKSCNLCGNSKMCEMKPGVIYVQDNIGTMSRQQCRQECNSRSGCQFWTWAENTRGCGIRDYETDGTRVPVDGLWTGRKDGGFGGLILNEELEDRVFISKIVFIDPYNREACKNACQNDNKCQTVSYRGSACKMNYGKPDREISQGISTFISSSKKDCY